MPRVTDFLVLCLVVRHYRVTIRTVKVLITREQQPFSRQQRLQTVVAEQVNGVASLMVGGVRAVCRAC